MKKIIIIGLGGCLGAISRYSLGQIISTYFSRLKFPLATLCVNLVGCVLFGFISEVIKQSNIHSQELEVFILVGFLGALTTFSSLEFESYLLFLNGYLFKAFINITINIFVGFAGLLFGKFYLSKFLY